MGFYGYQKDIKCCGTKVKCQCEFEWTFDEDTGKLTCTRNGLPEPWRDDPEKRAILALFFKCADLESEVE